MSDHTEILILQSRVKDLTAKVEKLQAMVGDAYPTSLLGLIDTIHVKVDRLVAALDAAALPSESGGSSSK